VVEYGAGQPVLAIHGAMGGWDQSALLADALGVPDSRTIAVSRPGYLGTPLASGRTPEEQAALLAALLDARGVDRVIVSAVSGGGASALHFAARYPDRCRALVLVSSPGTALTTALPARVQLLRVLRHVPGLVGAMAKRSRRGEDASAQRAVPDDALRAATLADPLAGPLLRRMLQLSSQQLPARLAGTFNDIDTTRTAAYPLSAIRAPTLIVHGGADRVVPYDPHASALAAGIAGSEVVTAPDGDHVFLFTHLARIRTAVHRFLQRHGAHA
jgi:pimeloyl-ACP methyl ester carboxylesterase